MSLKLRNIISMEDGDYEDVSPEAAEGAVDEVEAVEAADEITSETEVMDEYSEELDETVEDVQELEETQEVLETALENPDYEGLDEVSAEMIGQRLRNLSKRRGFDVDHVAGAFSKESFNTRTSGRRRKTEIAVEGIKDAIISMWERIKKAIKAVWQAIKDFWKKHISTMGRLLKALEKTKKRARDVNGAPTGEAPKPSSGLQKAFYTKSGGSISASVISEIGKRQDTATEASIAILNGVTDAVSTIVEKSGDENQFTLQFISDTFKLGKNIGTDRANDSNAITLSGIFDTYVKGHSVYGSENEPLVGGWFAEIDDSGMSETKKTFEFKWDQREVKPSDKKTLSVANKNAMTDLCDNAIQLIKKTQRFGDNFNKASSKYDQAMNKFSQSVSKLDDEADGDTKKALQVAMRLMNDVSRLLPKINSKIAGLNVTFGKQVISFCNTCMSNYKEA